MKAEIKTCKALCSNAGRMAKDRYWGMEDFSGCPTHHMALWVGVASWWLNSFAFTQAKPTQLPPSSLPPLSLIFFPSLFLFSFLQFPPTFCSPSPPCPPSPLSLSHLWKKARARRLTTQQHPNSPLEQICLDKFLCCHTEIEDANETCYLTKSLHADTRPISPSTNPILPGVWQSSHSGTNLYVTGINSTGAMGSDTWSPAVQLKALWAVSKVR